MMNPNANGLAGLSLLQQIQKMQQGNGGLASDPSGTPNFISNGLIGKMMQGNAPGLIGTLLKGGNAPVNPGAAPAAGDPAYVPGGAGPMAGGMPMNGPQFSDIFKGGGLGMLSGMFGGG